MFAALDSRIAETRSSSSADAIPRSGRPTPRTSFNVGEVFDVAVDPRGDSPTLGQWVGERLSADNGRQLWVPVGFAHGFLTLSPVAEVQYKTAGYWSRECERSLAWNDPAIGIDWPLQELPDPHQPLLAPKDAAAPGLAALAAAGDLFALDNV